MLSANDKQLESLSQSAGVDLIGLREKYAAIGAQSVDEKTGMVSSGSNPVVSNEQERLVLEAHRRLDQMKICKTCQGLGTVKETYNFQVREKNCPDCDGDSLVWAQAHAEKAAGTSLNGRV